jgi:ubiquinone/menaquinone biosynthesis C-methylase UbiE
MRLNIGCGSRRLPGYTGVDAVATRSGVDIVAPAHRIPLEDGCADEILAVHLWEHFYRWECDIVIKEWRRVLKVGGLLVLELPNLRKCCENLISGRAIPGKHPDQLAYWGIYGDPTTSDPFMVHRWGWTPQTLSAFLLDHGFAGIAEKPTQFHPIGRDIRDMRIEALKAAKG